MVNAGTSGQVNMRRGPSVNYNIIGRLGDKEQVAILKSAPDGNWLEIETADQKIGWVSAKYIEVQGNRQDIPIATNLEPTPTSQPVTANLPTLDVEGGSTAGSLGPYQEQWYTFFENDSETILILMFDPNVNLHGKREVEFYLHDQNQIPVWPPVDANSLISHAVGASMHPDKDRDGDEGNGELVWRGGPLQRNMRYYLRIVNNSTSTLKYCLATRDVYQWTCPR